MRILMVGDVVGKPGRLAVAEHVPQIRAEHQVDFVIVNAENTAGGNGITPDIAISMLKNGSIDVLTLGNHAWGKREIYSYLDEEPRLLRPANYPPGSPGQGYGVYPWAGGLVGVISLQGRTFMEPVDDPFRTVDTILETLRPKTPILFIDFHAEATSEKQGFGYHVDGRVSAVVGTHTHIQTADERILPKGTAYLTDVGMTGPIYSIIGVSVDAVLSRFVTGLPARFEVADGEVQLCGVMVDVDPETGKATTIQRIQVPTHQEHYATRAKQGSPADPDDNFRTE